MEIDFTARLENHLDLVEEGKKDWKQLLDSFYKPFAKALSLAKKQMRQIKGQGVPAGIACPTCGQPLWIRLGKNGEFLSCSTYPDCKYTSDFSRDEQGKITPSAPLPAVDIKCDQCGAGMVMKKGRYGPFLACSAYPACKNNKAVDAEGRVLETGGAEELDEKCPQCGGKLFIRLSRSGGKFIACSGYPKCRYTRGLPLDAPCPLCGGELTERRSRRRGKVFYSCNNYPTCKFSVWDKPVAQICPDCGGKIMLEKKDRKGQITFVCPNPQCRSAANR
jgi:DNA topoisomerase-1